MLPSSNLGDNQKKTAVTNDPILEQPNLKGDWLNLFLLLLLYTMQGIPVGLDNAVPIILQSNKSVTYQDQALFSLVKWPYTLKLLWAPLVDSFFIQKIGRRKSWLLPIQFLLGALFFYMGYNIEDWLPKTGKPNIWKLVFVCFSSKMLAATQDVVVDGWALTILKKNNVGYSSTCGSMGTIIGVIIGTTFPILFTSEDFCNKYIRVIPVTGGLLSMKSILYFFGIIFVMITTFISIFKKEKDYTLEDNYVKLNTLQSYSLLWDILKLPSIQMLAIALLTVKVGFAAADHLSSFQLIDVGVSKDDLTIIDTVINVINIFVPLVVAKYTSDQKSISVFLKMIPIRLFWNITFVLIIYYTPTMIKTNLMVNVTIYYYVILVFILAVHKILINIQGIAITAFFCQISDSRFGGTYMTFLNTLSNIGYAWTSMVSLGILDMLTFKKCSFDSNNNCLTLDLQNTCKNNGGDCMEVANGFYTEMAFCTITGVVWYGFFKNVLKNLQNKNRSHWLVDVKQPVEKNDQDSYSMTLK